MPDDPFFILSASPLWVDFIPAAIEIQRGIAAHELQHGAVASVHESAFEIDLKIVGIQEQRPNRIGRLPDPFADIVAANRGRSKWVVEIQIPVNDVYEMHHQVGKDAVAEIPKPTPVTKTIFIERLIRCIAEKCFPIYLLGIDTLGSPAN